MTESIWLAGHRESFSAANVAIDVPDPKVDLLEPVISVNVEIGEQRIEKSFPGVIVSTAQGGRVEPATTSVTLLGAAKLLNVLKPEEIKIVLDSAGQGLEPRLELPDALKGKVTLKAIQATKFVSLR
jgi:hypothetical protein